MIPSAAGLWVLHSEAIRKHLFTGPMKLGVSSFQKLWLLLESCGSQPGNTCGQVSEGQTALQELGNTEETLGLNTERKIKIKKRPRIAQFAEDSEI